MAKDPQEQIPSDSMLSKFFQFFYNNKYSAAIILIGLTIISLSKVFDAGQNVFRKIGLVNSFDINQETPRGRVSYEILQAAGNRVYWMNSYSGRIRYLAPAVEIEQAWAKYHEAMERWNTNLLSYSLQLEEYYPHSDKHTVFLHTIQPGFAHLNLMLVDLRYKSGFLYFNTPSDTTSDSTRWKNIKTKLDLINHSIEVLQTDLYYFFDARELEGKSKSR